MAVIGSESLAACEGRAGMTIQEELIKRFHAAFDTMLHKAAEKGSAVVRVPISDLGILIEQADLACASIDGFVTRLVGAANGHAVEVELAKRFLDTMRDVVAKATERKPLATKIPAADLYLLLQFAKAGPIDYSRVRFIGANLASGPDRTVATNVEVVDGSAKVTEMVNIGPSLTEALEQGNK
jgi:hypothetical protein